MAQTLDPPQVDETHASPASTDDLLSQLAGDEIDRLLAEAEGEKPVSSPALAETTPPAPVNEAVVESAPQTLTEVAAPQSVAADQPVASTVDSELAPTAIRDDAAVNAELDELFKELNADAGDASASAASFDAVPESAQSDAELPNAVDPLQAAGNTSVSETDLATSKQEHAALTDSLHDEDDEAADAGSTSTPVYLKPLEWLNMPMQLVPEASRDLVGKVAIISFMNAVSVLAYLLIFRR